MTSTTFFIIFIPILAILLLAINLILAPHNPWVWSGKSIIWGKLSNSGNTLKLLIPSIYWKINCGWTNYSCMVISQKMYESKIGDRGSKSIISNIIVKEQRVNGSWYENKFSYLRCTLVGFERNTPLRNLYAGAGLNNKDGCLNYIAKIPSNQINLTRNYSQLQSKLNLNPDYITGFTNAFLLVRYYKGIQQFHTQNLNSHSLSLVVWGTNLTSTAGSKYTRTQLAMVCLPPYQYSVIIGLLLSDGWLILASKTHKNVRLGFLQGGVHGKYFWFVFLSLSHYCSSYPSFRIRTRFGKQTISWEFFTRSMTCLTELHPLFYSSGVKIIPKNIYDLLTPVALAHLVMGDGSKERHGLIICTDSYYIEDVVRLINVLIIKYRIECTIKVRNQDKYRIYIREESMPLLREIIKPYMCSSMLYKIKL